MKIYLASPYSHPHSHVRNRRFDKAVLHAGMLIQEGHIVYSPITHNHPIAEIMDLPRGWDYWQQFDRAFLEWCEVMCILQLTGWDKSEGIRAEKDIAFALQRPVIHWNPADPLPDLTF